MTNTSPAAALDAAPAWATTYTRLALSELPADITTATPPQVDEVIRTARIDRDLVLSVIPRHLDEIHRGLGHRRESERVGIGRQRETRFFWIDGNGAEVTGSVEPLARAMAEAKRPGAVVLALRAIDAVRAVAAEIDDVIARCDAEYHRRGCWTRYYRVNNTDGHVHKRTSCKETYVTTSWTWPTSLSGQDSPGVVDASGSLTCLTCFPEVRGTILEERPPRLETFETREQTADRQAREQEKADKLAAKIAKGVTADGSPLAVRFDGRTNEIKTERAAELRYVDCSWDEVRVIRNLEAHLAREEHNAAYIERARAEIAEYAAAAETLAKALAWKRGTTVDAIRDQLGDRVAKRVARGY